jgi:inhibitor of KinA sporulation pathway (predicted exonuclease)
LQFAKNKTILSVDLWSSLQGSRRTPGDVAKDVVELFELITRKSPNTQVGIISEGDPLYRDYRVEKIRQLVPNHRVIASPSSAELCLQELYDLEDVRGLPVCTHLDNLIDFYNNSINVYSCLGIDYNKDLTSLIEKMTQSNVAYVIKIGDGKSVQKYSGAQLKDLLKLREFRVFLMDKTVLVYNHVDPK